VATKTNTPIQSSAAKESNLQIAAIVPKFKRKEGQNERTGKQNRRTAGIDCRKENRTKRA
jgi:hypothetical protein